MGTQLPSLKGAQPPQIFGPYLFWPNGWMDQDMPLGTEIGLGSGHIALDGDPTPSSEGAQLSIFDPCMLWPKWQDGSRCYLIGR